MTFDDGNEFFTDFLSPAVEEAFHRLILQASEQGLWDVKRAAENGLDRLLESQFWFHSAADALWEGTLIVYADDEEDDDGE